jgi:ribosome-binding ATPase YchF (GTP1/OBG family)
MFLQELWDLRGPDKAAEKAAFLEAAGAAVSALPRIIQVGYSELNLMYYFTAGDKEVRRASSDSHDSILCKALHNLRS